MAGNDPPLKRTLLKRTENVNPQLHVPQLRSCILGQTTRWRALSLVIGARETDRRSESRLLP